ncbi:hypothetical protein BKP35_05085 [Anaerobacillus arseniciselenatis]|uniref:HTH psq-type domain-containing protein n=1 Tax=Anaerobacillus arseniciselenatis TaxID=85682 RepID=A0A1S2LSC0_9BACI|nr:SEC-C metal-binding domain-containing protein [Anaerobacillus arseniciselenatis]OIJ15224.1 hypothetical protein BKP35_05085 [Anaerobacillus arseniciselenatis]
MIKIGRNDSCPCGSGKKYKKCCGKNNVITVGHIIEKELEEIHKDIIQYAMTNYDDFIQDYVEKYHHDIEFPEEAAEVFHFYCTLYVITTVEMENGKTILVEYIDRYVHKQKRQQIKDIMRSWAKARPSISIVCEKDDNNDLKVEDFFAEEMMTLSVPEDHADISVGGMLLSIILPAGHEKWMTFTVGLDITSDKTEKMTTKILRLLEETGLDSTEFVTSNFIELVSEFIYTEAELTATDVEWQSQAQFEVAQLLEEKISNYFSQGEIINLAFMLWQKFCDKKNPRIQKPVLYVAAIIYLMDQMMPFGIGVTQAGLAKDFNIPSSSISNKFKELEAILSEDINELKTRLHELNNGVHH